MPFDGFGEEIELWIDVDHNAGGAWGTANWVQLGGAASVERNPGLVSAEFPDRSKKHIGHRRSKTRNPQLNVEAENRPGDAAFDRLVEATDDVTNTGAEILRVMVVNGSRTEAGNTAYEADFVVTEDGGPGSGFGEASNRTLTLRHAADSPNVPLKSTTSGS